MRTARRRALVVVVAVVVVLVGAIAVHRYAQRQVPVVVDPVCPALLTGTDNAAQDFADVVTWAGRTYVKVDDGPDWVQGDVTGVVGCSIAEMRNPKGWRVAPGAWPDGTATRLSRGVVLRSVGDRGLAAEEPGALSLYCEADAGTLDPTC